MKSTLKRMIAKTPYRIHHEEAERQAELRERFYIEEIKALTRFPEPSDVRTEVVIYSMDRALQLHALLKSYFSLVSDAAPVHIIYRTTSELHSQTYAELRSLWKDEQVNWISQEQGARLQPMTEALLAKLESGRVMFLVDDDLVIRPFTFDQYVQFEPRCCVPALRLGQHLDFCYTKQVPQSLPNFVEMDGLPSEYLYWRWSAGEHNWNYPLSITAHIFGRDEMLAMVRAIDFKTPNVFEGLLQEFNALFLDRLGVAPREAVIVNNPCNKVQTDNDNVHGQVHQDDLAEAWLQGQEFDGEKYVGYQNHAAHEELPLILKERDGSTRY